MNATISKRNSLLLLGLALLAGAILRLWNINQSFWWDEIWSTLPYAKAHSVFHSFTDLGYYFNNHLLNSLLVRCSIAIFGESELTARLPALLMGLLAIVAVFQFGRLFADAGCGIIAAVLLAFSPFHIDHSTEARGYAGLALFSLLSSLYFLKGLKTNQVRSWVWYVLFTVLGFCSHVFAAAVLISQFFLIILLVGMTKWLSGRVNTTLQALRSGVVSLFCAGCITVLIYSPMLSDFFANAAKVRLVGVTRLPFIMSLVHSFLFPGSNSVTGSVVYGALFLAGLYVTLNRDPLLFIYLVVLFLLPLTVYLLINPMFVFERYFIFVLPLALVVVSRGITALTGRFGSPFRSIAAMVLVAMLVYLQFPAMVATITRDRQNYREAVRYVEKETQGRREDLVFSIGYAGEHFRYYARQVFIHTPETVDALSALMEDKQHAWCLITAWLPDLRPPHEDAVLYAERPGQVEIYNYVKTHFVLKKHFASKYGVDIYYGENIMRP